MEAICSFLAARTMDLETDVYPALDMLTSKVHININVFFSMIIEQMIFVLSLYMHMT